MLSLALNYGKGPVFLKDIAKREEISEKYLSLIIIPLRGAGLINSFRGAYGGYTLAREPSKINVKEIVDVLEGDCLVNCIKDSSACSRISTCAARDIWILLGGKISETLESITLEKLTYMSREKAENSLSHQI
jgi:Rrf2 family protein